eukprot:9032054-Lingulodinium_polyedra.AAC.1
MTKHAGGPPTVAPALWPGWPCTGGAGELLAGRWGWWESTGTHGALALGRGSSVHPQRRHRSPVRAQCIPGRR